MPRILSLVAVLLSAWTLSARAGDVLVVRSAGDSVDPAEVAQILTRTPVKMRSLRLLDDAPAGSAVAATAAVAAAAAAAQAAGPSALSLPVPFAFDSAEILPGAKAQLDAVAAGIRLLPATQKVVIEGHTDAIGGDAYNEMLSTRRAESVRRYLAAVHGIDAGRLEAVGKGKDDPLPGRDPKAGENRRVQFRGG
ncbi:MAG: OmpA family protein [Ideonella sp.]|nr:OmpA family protein [Ideonella sp.]MCC7455499.1 OmpA family protein [Nitrospira sp.]